MSNEENSVKIQFTIEEFIKYKSLNKSILPELIDFCNTQKRSSNTHYNNHHNHHHNNNWRKPEPLGENWILASKLKQTDDEKLYSNIRSLLNKLSDSNFDVLISELMALDISKSEHLIKLVEFLFIKALTEPKFGYMYAKLAKGLVNFSIKEQDNVFCFRELLIRKCQMMFNDCVSFDTVNTNITKERAMGCMSFIGELYLCDLLNNKIINSCFLLMLIKVDNTKPYLIEFISTLMKVVSKTFIIKCPNESKIVFEKIQKIIDSGDFLSKEKFTLMDIMDLIK